MKQPSPIIVWFRNNLRISDNPCLFHAAQKEAPLILIYIAEQNDLPWSMGQASKWWARNSLLSLQNDLKKKYHADLIFQKGDPETILSALIKKTKATDLFCDLVFEPDLLNRDLKIEKSLHVLGIKIHRLNTALLHAPWEYRNRAGTPWKVFTPFWKSLYLMEKRDCSPLPRPFKNITPLASLNIDEIYPLPQISWYTNFEKYWKPGEENAKIRLAKFLKEKLVHYADGRNRPDQSYTSHLSPHLHFGEISPLQIWHAALRFPHHEKFLSELAWREFSYHLLYYFPDLPEKPFRPEFSSFPWKKNKKFLQQWQKGCTGYPIVDAGMRELWTTGYMHNRVRMIAASFLIKHLLQPWQEGEAWFWDTLLDADLANNAASWQWVAGSGADAAPYFRIFNPILQGEKFDPDAKYVKKWIPALKDLPVAYCHAPWTAPAEILKQSHCELGKDYPHPIVDHNAARKLALEAYKKIKK